MNVLGGESPLDDNGVSTQKEHDHALRPKQGSGRAEAAR